MERLKVLVVDDEARMRKLVKDFLTRENYEVLEAENGEQAVDIFFSDKNTRKKIYQPICGRCCLSADGGQWIRTFWKKEIS